MTRWRQQMQREAARPKGNRAPGDQPTSQPMRATRQGEVRRNPSSDQKRVRRENQRKVAIYGQDGFLTRACSPDGDGQCDGYSHRGEWCECPCHEEENLPGTAQGTREWHERMHADDADDLRDGNDTPEHAPCYHCLSYGHDTEDHDSRYSHHKEDWEYGEDAARSQPEHEASRKVAGYLSRDGWREGEPPGPCTEIDTYGQPCSKPANHDGRCHFKKTYTNRPMLRPPAEPGSDKEASRRKAAMSQQKIATMMPGIKAWQLNPGDGIRMPNGRTMKVHRVRPHETSGKHVYVDTDGGTTISGRDDPFEVVHQNQQQKSLPGYGIPGGNTNRLPVDPQTNNEKSDNQGGKHCPSCGAKGSMQRQGDKYVCSRCGYQQTYGGAGGHSFTDQPHQLKTGTFYTTINSSGMSAIARRAHEALAQKEIK